MSTVCIATPLYPPELGGPATYAALLEQHLPEHGMEVVLVKFSAVRRLPRLVRHLAYLVLLLRRARHADSILALDPVSVGLPAALAARLLGKPLVVKVVGDYAWEQGRQRFGVTETLDAFVRTRQRSFQVRMLQRIEAWVARKAQRIIVPSQYLERIVSNWNGVRPERIAVIYNAIKAEAGGTAPPSVQSAPRPRITSIGRLVPWKHMDGIMDAVAQSGTTLVIVGEGPERARLEAHPAASHTVFTGALSHADALATLRESDIFVLNSSYEGLSHVLIEALSLGVPVIATDAGGNPELITDGENGVLVPVGDTGALRGAIEALLGDASRRAALADRARASAEVFSETAMVMRTQELLTTLV